MIDSLRIAAALLLFAISSGAWATPKTDSFSTARDAFLEKSGCTSAKHLPAGKDHGDMSTCVMGSGRTVVWEVEKAPDSDTIQRIRFTWFDFGVHDPSENKVISPHVDQAEAELMVDAFLETYAPCRKASLTEGFFGTGADATKNRDGDHISVEHFHNPSLVERVILVRPDTARN